MIRKFLAAALAAASLAPIKAPAQERVCPHFLAQYCVERDDGGQETRMTNPCLAERDHVKVVHPGPCNKQ
jgi:hypothetical protein